MIKLLGRVAAERFRNDLSFKQFWEREQVCFWSSEDSAKRGAPTLITGHNYIGTTLLRGAPVTLLSYKDVSANDVHDRKREKHDIA